MPYETTVYNVSTDDLQKVADGTHKLVIEDEDVFFTTSEKWDCSSDIANLHSQAAMFNSLADEDIVMSESGDTKVEIWPHHSVGLRASYETDDKVSVEEIGEDSDEFEETLLDIFSDVDSEVSVEYVGGYGDEYIVVLDDGYNSPAYLVDAVDMDKLTNVATINAVGSNSFYEKEGYSDSAIIFYVAEKENNDESEEPLSMDEAIEWAKQFRGEGERNIVIESSHEDGWIYVGDEYTVSTDKSPPVGWEWSVGRKLNDLMYLKPTDE